MALSLSGEGPRDPLEVLDGVPRGCEEVLWDPQDPLTYQPGTAPAAGAGRKSSATSASESAARNAPEAKPPRRNRFSHSHASLYILYG